MTGPPPGRPALRLLAGRRCQQTQWRHLRLRHLLVLPAGSGDGYAVVQVVRSPAGPWVLRVVATGDGRGVDTDLPAEFPLDHLVWQVLDRAGQPARTDPATLAATDPAEGAVVRYHGDLTAHHGIFWLVLADHPDDLVLRNDDGLFLRARASSVTVLA